MDPGAVAGACACALLVGTAGEPTRSAIPIALWQAICRAHAENSLTSAFQDPTWTACAGWLAVTFPVVHAACEADARRDRLALLLNPVRATSADFLTLLRLLSDGGVEAVEIDAALRGPAIEQIVQRTIADADRGGPVSFSERRERQELKRLATVLLGRFKHEVDEAKGR